MNTKDQHKLLKAGYTILRTSDHPTVRIKIKNPLTEEWETLEYGFKSKAGRDRRMNEFLESPTVLED